MQKAIYGKYIKMKRTFDDAKCMILFVVINEFKKCF